VIRWAILPGFVALLGFVGFCESAERSAAETSRNCEAVASDIAAARAAGDLGRLPLLFEEVKSGGSCGEVAIHCLGDSVALGHLEVAYGMEDTGAPPEAIASILEKGLQFGSPWQLSFALGDLHMAQARSAHDGAIYSSAAFDYQEGLIALDQPPVCGAYGEAPYPAANEIAAIYKRMTTALLLARPVKVATTKCAPCEWLFMESIAGFTPATRPLPITFDKDSTEPTPEGRTAALALLECAKGLGYSRIVLSGHTDQTGSANYNMTLSARRLEYVKTALVDGGYQGEIVLEPKGKSEPYRGEETGFSEDEVKRLNRRIELRQFTAREAQTCGQ
jgi:outer membrane protein OmpA-like peptidoglycan-associated protein